MIVICILIYLLIAALIYKVLMAYSEFEHEFADVAPLAIMWPILVGFALLNCLAYAIDWFVKYVTKLFKL